MEEVLSSKVSVPPVDQTPVVQSQQDPAIVTPVAFAQIDCPAPALETGKDRKEIITSSVSDGHPVTTDVISLSVTAPKAVSASVPL